MSPEQGGDKTEKATPKRRRDARSEGQVAKSNDVVIAGSLLVCLFALKLFGPFLITNMQNMLARTLSLQIPDVMTIASTMSLLIDLCIQFAIIVLPMLGTALVVGVVTNVIQVGLQFTPKAMMPKFSRINPIEGFKRLFSSKQLIELCKSVIKLTVLGAVAYSEYQTQVLQSRGMMGTSMTSILLSLNTMVDMIFAIGFKLVLALLIIAPFDYFYQWWRHEKDLRMSKQEVKDEYKMTEGDPQIKGKIKQKQREMSAMRMMQAMSAADVVITNPTHYAVALVYEDGKHAAPIIVAKGKDFLAQKLKEEADKFGIPKVENRAVAQYLYFFCEVGDEVPEDMYAAVAEILAYIYKLHNNVQRRGVR